MKLQPFRHLYLYAKGRYVTSDDVLDDLYTLLSNETMIDVEDMGIGDVFAILAQVCYPHLTNYNFGKLIFGINELTAEYIMSKGTTSVKDRTIESMLSIVRQVPVLDDKKNAIMNLGEADPNILPLKDVKSF